MIHLNPNAWRLLSGIGAGLLVLVALGCEAGSKEPMIPVAGKVTIGGQPLTTGNVMFHPDASRGNSTQHIPSGLLDAQGSYKVLSATYTGAPAGWYKVAVISFPPSDEKDPYAPVKSLINPKFANAQTSGLAVEVVPKAPPGTYDFQVTK